MAARDAALGVAARDAALGVAARAVVTTGGSRLSEVGGEGCWRAAPAAPATAQAASGAVGVVGGLITYCSWRLNWPSRSRDTRGTPQLRDRSRVESEHVLHELREVACD